MTKVEEARKKLREAYSDQEEAKKKYIGVMPKLDILFEELRKTKKTWLKAVDKWNEAKKELDEARKDEK